MSKPLPVYDSLVQCNGQTGIPIAVLKHAKKAGCPAFKAHRVYLAELLPWLFKAGAEGAAHNWGEELRKEQALRQRLKRKHEAKHLVPREAVVESFARFGGRITAARLKSEQEHPLRHAAAGDDVPAQRDLVRATWDDIIAAVREAGGVFGEIPTADQDEA